MLNTSFEDILNSQLLKTVGETADALELETYAIGGFVRDHMLNRKRGNADIDFVVIGSGITLAKEVQKKLPKASKVQVFKTYGTAMIRYEGVELEFVGARKESYNEDSRNPIVENGTLEEDQNRRDFTVNAMAISLNSATYGQLLDPFNGLKDLTDKCIKTPLNPEVTYSDDPLRMLRAIRFATQLDFEIESASLKAIKNLSNRIEIITNERINVEVQKILESKKPSLGFLLLEKTGLLQRIIPELTDLKGVDIQEGQKHKDNFYHTLEVVDNISNHTDNVWLRWAALLHDIGKAPTKRFSKKVGWTFHGHELKGSKMVYHLFKRLKMPLNEKMKYVQKLVFMSSRPIVLAQENITDSAVRRLVFDAGEFVEDLMTLCEADITTKNPYKFKKYHNNFKLVREKIVEVEERDHLRDFQPPISGETIMETFNLKPSKEIGIIKEFIKEAILEGIIPNDSQKAFELMLKKGAELGLNTGNEK